MNSYICPKCKHTLILTDRTYRCPENHCYDIAKEGYVNLLPIKSKKSKDPGDNSKMTMARRSFLETDLYKVLAYKVAEVLKESLGNGTSNILDLGCGEGYYTGIISNNLSSSIFNGIDISKVAVRYGSKKYKNINFCVASAFELPIADNSIDAVTRIYAPSSEVELNRVIKKNGYLLTVTPGDRHLYQLREIIYKEVLNLSTKDDSTENFERIKSENLCYTMEIKEAATIQNLLDMTPFGWKISKEDHKKLFMQSSWSIEADFKIVLYKHIS